jgi:hypothetical protein
MDVENITPASTIQSRAVPQRQFNYQPAADFTRFPSFVGFEDLLEELDEEDD